MTDVLAKTNKWFKRETYEKIREEGISELIKPFTARTHPNILSTIGYTPLIRLNRIFSDIPGNFYLKMEASNPGNSAKDRIAFFMVEQAEARGEIKPGGTLIEATSGNTGFSLAMVAAVKGYKCHVTTTTKISREKLSALKAMGAQVEICDSTLPADHPDSYYSRAKSLAENIPNSFYVNQNFNRDNPNAHYHTTGPEIWRQTKGKVTHFLAACGTGGTISGTSRYLLEQNPDINVTGVDAYGSILKHYHETKIVDDNERYSYLIEGLGKNIITANQDFELISQFVKVRDKDAAFTARNIARLEGMFLGFSSAAVVQAVYEIKDSFKPSDIVVMLACDHGNLYLSKIYDDDWMREKGLM